MMAMLSNWSKSEEDTTTLSYDHTVHVSPTRAVLVSTGSAARLAPYSRLAIIPVVCATIYRCAHQFVCLPWRPIRFQLYNCCSDSDQMSASDNRAFPSSHSILHSPSLHESMHSVSKSRVIRVPRGTAVTSSSSLLPCLRAVVLYISIDVSTYIYIYIALYMSARGFVISIMRRQCGTRFLFTHSLTHSLSRTCFFFPSSFLPFVEL